MKLIVPVLLALSPLLAAAKLPALSPDAQAKADEAKAKTAWSDKVAAFQLCRAQDRAAESYRKSAKAAGKQPKPAASAPACADPGPFAAAVPAASKPIEAAGAHSPAATAITPPSSTTATQAQVQGSAKK